MRAIAGVILGLALLTGCARREQAGAPPGAVRTLTGLTGRFAYAEPAAKCPACYMYLCADVNKTLPFVGPAEASGQDNPNPIPVAYDPKLVNTEFREGDFVLFDLHIDWTQDQPLRLTSIKFLKRGSPGLDSSCPDIAE